jgi:hypothetical protein
MAVIVNVIVHDVTQEQYDQVRAVAGWLQRLPEGGIAHLTWWSGQDSHSVDAWESESAFQTFVEQRLGPAMARVGVKSEPQITFFPAHEVFLPKSATLTATPA